MAPEQLVGDRATERTDLYALGLVLYELYAGRRLFPVQTFEERRHVSHDTSVAHPLPGIDPEIERIIHACLERDPAERPRSALAIAALLPGGDPLAAALAEGRCAVARHGRCRGSQGRLAPRAGLDAVGAPSLSEPLWLRPRLMWCRSPRRTCPSRPTCSRSARGTSSPLAGADETQADREFWFAPDPLAPRSSERLSRRRAPRAADATPLESRSSSCIGRVRTIWSRRTCSVSSPIATHPEYAGDGDCHPRSSGTLGAFRQSSCAGRAGSGERLDPQIGIGCSPRRASDSTSLSRRNLTARPLSPMTVVSAGTREARYPAHSTSRSQRSMAKRCISTWRATASRRMPLVIRSQPADLGRSTRCLAAIVVSIFAGAAILARRNLRLGQGDRRAARNVAVVVWADVLSGILRAHHVPVALEEVTFLFGMTRLDPLLGSVHLGHLHQPRTVGPPRVAVHVNLMDPVDGRASARPTGRTRRAGGVVGGSHADRDDDRSRCGWLTVLRRTCSFCRRSKPCARFDHS